MEEQRQTNNEISYDDNLGDTTCANISPSDIKTEIEASPFELDEEQANSRPTKMLTVSDNDYVPKPDWLLNLLVEMRDEIISLKSEISDMTKEIIESKDENKRSEISDMKKEIIKLKDENKRSLYKLAEEVIAAKLESRKHFDANILNEEFKDLQKFLFGVMDDLQKFDEEL